MSRKQNQGARQPVAQQRGRDTSPRQKPATTGSSSFIRNAGRNAPAAPAAGTVKRRRDGSVAAAPKTRRDGTPFERSASAPAAPSYRRDPSAAAAAPAAPKTGRFAPKIARAKKLSLRAPSQKVALNARRLRETRVDYDHIEPVRLQKALAASGVGSRREMEDWIEAGLVLVNGKKAGLGDRVGPRDRVTVKGNPIRLKWPDRLPRVILYHKQEGELVTRDDPQGRITVFDRLPQAKSSRWIAIGRLDVNTSGLLILTTSGELANRLMHPSFEVEREYAVRVLGELSDDQRKELTREIELEDGPARFERVIDQGGEGANHWYRVVIKEGRNREVRRMFDFFGLQVSRLMRVRFGNIGLPPRLKRGQFYELNELEVAAVMKWSDLTVTGSRKPR